MAAGEELLVAYGHSYWIAHHGGEPIQASPAVMQTAGAAWGADGLAQPMGRLAAKYAKEVQLLSGLLEQKPTGR